MLKQEQKDILMKLELPYRPVAIKFCYAQPEGVKHLEKKLSFCQFLKECQDSGEEFFITKDNDECFGKMVLGMVPKDPLAASGQAGVDFGVFKSQAPNARLYNEITTLVPGATNFVWYAPVDKCRFDPDVVMLVAPTEKADIIMRATSYISGDLWESKVSCVLSCAWMYSYPYVSGKVNYCITGLHHGLKRRKIYPAGLHMIAVPYQKLLEVTTALMEMDWSLIAMREDEESKAELARRMAGWQKLSPDFAIKD